MVRKGARTVHNGQFQGNGNGKRWLLIALLVLGGFWLVNDAYDDGYRDGLLQSGQGQTSAMWRYHDGPDFPWGLVILGGIGYIAWRKGAFDRFGGPGGPFGNGGNHGEGGVQRYGTGNSPTYVAGQQASTQGSSPVFRGPRAFFEEWHRQAHEEAARAQYPASPAPQAGAPNSSHEAPQAGFAPTPPPTPPAPEYWASMAGAAEAASNPGTAVTPPAAPDARQDEHPDASRGATGTAV
jgi:hypothetical protein